MNFKLELTGIKEFQEACSELARQQIPLAITRALNRTAGGIAKAERHEMEDVFKGGVTPYLTRGIKTREAAPGERSVEVSISDRSPGKSALSPSQILRPQIFGGEREIKASEMRLRRAGLMGEGQYLTPGPGAPRDARGNISGPQMQRLLGYTQAYGESGYNKTVKTNKHYVIPFVGVFKWIGKNTSVPVLFFTYARPQYQELFDFYFVFQNYIEKNFLRNLIEAWASIRLKAGRYGG